MDRLTLAMIVYLLRKEPSPAPPVAIAVEVGHCDQEDDPPFIAKPGPNAPDIMFRLTTAAECASLGAGFKLYGVGRWEAPAAGGEDCGKGRLEGFAVTPKVAADVLNGLFRMGWELSTCPPHLLGIHERAWNPKYPDDIRPLGAWVVEAECTPKESR